MNYDEKGFPKYIDISKVSLGNSGFCIYNVDVYDVTDVYKVIEKEEGFVPSKVYNIKETPHIYSYFYYYNIRIFFAEKEEAFDFINRWILNEL